MALDEGNWYISNRRNEQLNIWDEQDVRKDVWQKKEPRRLQRGVHLLLDGVHLLLDGVHLLLDGGAGGAEGRCLESSIHCFHKNPQLRTWSS